MKMKCNLQKLRYDFYSCISELENHQEVNLFVICLKKH